MVEKHGEPAAPKRRTGLTRAVVVLAILLVLGAAVYMIGMSGMIARIKVIIVWF